MVDLDFAPCSMDGCMGGPEAEARHSDRFFGL